LNSETICGHTIKNNPLIKVENEEIKYKSEKSLLEILDLMDKARNKEIMTAG
jgi:hypothetical protein